MTPADKARAKQERDARVLRVSLHRQRWRAADSVRRNWSEDDHAAEQEALSRQIEEMVEAGQVTICEPAWANAGHGSADTRNLLRGWVITEP